MLKSIHINNRRYTPADIDLLIAGSSFLSRSLWEQKIFLFLQEWWKDTDSIQQNTSGSTGVPQQIILSKHAMVVSAERTCAFFGLGANSRAALCLSADYIAGKMMIVRALVSGMHLIAVAPEGNPYQAFDRDIDFVAMVPLQASNMLSSIAERSTETHQVRTVLLGGAEVSPVLEQKIIDQAQISFFMGYGMTETCSHVALRKLGLGQLPYYTAMDGVSVSEDQRGCLVIDDPEVVGTVLVTNDIVEFSATDPNSFRWKGRQDNIINSGGIKFSPEELEQKISHLIATPFLITSVADERLGRKMILVIEQDRTEQNVAQDPYSIQSLRAELQLLLHQYAVPREIIIVPELAKTAGGKVDRRYDYCLDI